MWKRWKSQKYLVRLDMFYSVGEMKKSCKIPQNISCSVTDDVREAPFTYHINAETVRIRFLLRAVGSV